jgi:hypothetical protein
MSFGTSILKERKEPIGNRGCDRRDIPYCFLSPLSLSLSLSLHSLLCFAFCAVLLVKKRRRETRQQCAHSQIFTTTSTAAVAAAMAATAMACTQLAAAAAPAVAGGVAAQRSRFYAGSVSHAGRRFGCSNGSRVSCMAEWLPGQPRPPYLDGSAPGYVYGSQSTTTTFAY